MYLTTRGKPQKCQLKLAKNALKWYGRRLLGKRLYDIVDVELDFTFEDIDRKSTRLNSSH